ncbi:hypothetical protein [Sphingomonas sp. VNH70]|uniref:hypothetical protein n=1 Tax=Sphingomonas silueang TaxID=3156617 RepID=UPI0032B3A989
MSEATYDRMAASLGSLLLLWARIERAAQQEVVRRGRSKVPPTSFHGVAKALQAWRATVSDLPDAASLSTRLADALCDRLQRPRNIRNGLCHGLIGIVSAHDGRPGRLLWEMNGVEKSVTWEELQEMFGWLAKVPQALGMISADPRRSPFDRRIDSPENREWWRTEFALALE